MKSRLKTSWETLKTIFAVIVIVGIYAFVQSKTYDDEQQTACVVEYKDATGNVQVISGKTAAVSVD